MRRISIVGSSGAGKTTLARALARQRSLTHVELDSLRHQRDWQPLPTETFQARVQAVVATDAWVIDGNYSAVREIIWARADTVVFLDLPRWRVMSRLVPRTLRRVVTQQELWNGNRERWQNLVSLDPNENVMLWSWTHHALYRARYVAAMADPAWSHIDFVRLRSPAEVHRLLASHPERRAPARAR